MMVSQVFVAEVESLRGRFPSYEALDDQQTSGSNMIKYHKRHRREKLLHTFFA
jgi:hypothetical protein